MSLGAYVAGWIVFAVVLAGPVLGAWLIVSRRLAWMALEARVVAFALLVGGFVFVEHLVPLALGVLSRGTVLAASALVLLAASRIRAADGPDPEAPRGEPGDAFAWRLALVVVGLVTAYAVGFLAENRAIALGDVDATGFHLPVVARWIQDGTLWKLNDFAPGWGFGEYPHTGNVLQLAVVLPWHDDFLLRAVGPLCLTLAALGIYALGAELGATRPVAAIMAMLGVAVPTAAVVGLNHGQTDIVAMAGFSAGALFLARHARTGQRAELLLAALGLGLAFGTKWYGPPEAIAVILVWVVARALMSRGDGRRWRPALGDGVFVGGVVVLIGGIWMLRNGVLAGDPVFPRRVSPLGVTLFSGTHSASEPYDFALLHYLGNTDLLFHGIRRQLERRFGAPGLLILLSTLAALIPAARVRNGRVFAVAIASLLLFAVYVATPYTAQGPEGLPQVTAGVRYVLPSLAIGAAAGAWFFGRLGRAGIVGAFGLTLLAILQSVDKLRDQSLEFRHLSFGTVVFTGFALVLVAALAVRIAQARPAPRTLAAGGLALLLAALLVGRDVQTSFDKKRYRIIPTYTWLQTVPKKPIRVGLAGRNGNNKGYSSPYIAFGPRLRNHVEYVGPRHKHLLGAYHSRAAFLAAVRRGRFDVLLIGPETQKSEYDLGRPLAWAKSAGWRPFLHDSRFTLLAPPKA